jgi:hypothetical protein
LTIIKTNKEIFKNELFEKYKELLIKLKTLNDKDNNQKCSLKEFEDFLFNKEEYKNINNYNPKFLLNNIITELNLYISSEFNNSSIADNFFITVEIIKRCLSCNKFSEDVKNEEKFLVFDLYKAYNEKNGEKKFSIYDCLKSYTNENNEEVNLNCDICKKETKHKIKKLFKTLPNVLIIFIDYGNDNNFEFKGDFLFNEELNFSNIKNVEINNKNKKYYLSSFICVREIMRKKEYYYTFCRENNDEHYFCYNGEMVHEVNGIKDKIAKNIIKLNNKKERLPYALIYNSFIKE